MGGPRLASASIDEILQSDVVTVAPDAAITEVVEKMASEEVGSVIVVDDEAPVGVVTDRAIALSLHRSPEISGRTVEEFVSGDVITGSTEMTVFEVLDQLEDHAIRRPPIVDEEGSLEGIVTLDDVFVLLNAEMDQATSIVESQSPRF
jgi:CBS domain-containing protein